MQLDLVWLGQGLAIDLVNTYVPAQDADLFAQWRDMQRQPQKHQVGSPREARPLNASDDELLELREAVTQLIDARINSIPLPRSATRTVNATSARHPRSLEVSAGNRVDVVEGYAGAVARDAMIAVTSGPQLARCPAPGCGMVHPMRRSDQRWCSASCGNRGRVARHQAAKQGKDA